MGDQSTSNIQASHKFPVKKYVWFKTPKGKMDILAIVEEHTSPDIVGNPTYTLTLLIGATRQVSRNIPEVNLRKYLG